MPISYNKMGRDGAREAPAGPKIGKVPGGSMDMTRMATGSRRTAAAAFAIGTALALAPAARGAETLGSLAAKRGIKVGAAVGGAFWGSDARYKETLQREFNMLVAENAMKFDQVEPSRGKFRWTQADDLADYAAAHGIALRGHCLVWHQQAGWLEAATGLSRADMLEILKTHIDSTAGRYRGKVVEWDVVNEAVADDGAGLRNSFWLQRIGPDFLDSAFAWAHRADPQALLFYNDYGAEGSGAKSERVYALVKGMKERGIPIHGVGMQCHFESGRAFSTTAIAANMKRIAALGLKISITELDFRVKLPADSAALSVQKDNYAQLLRTCLAEPGCGSFLTWGFTDAHSWVPGFFAGQGAALPFDAAYAPKPAYAGMALALAETSGLRRAAAGGRPYGNRSVTLRIRDWLGRMGPAMGR